MKQQVVYIHGGKAFSKYENFLEYLRTTEVDPFKEHEERWPTNLASELGDGFEVIAPSMPNKQNARYEEWKIWFERHIPFLRGGVTLLGWSQGGYFLVRYLTENVLPVSVRALYLVAAPFYAEDFGGEDGGDFAFDLKLLPRLEDQVPNVHIFHSTDDFVVPYEHAEAYATHMKHAELTTFTDRNHFLQERFPELVTALSTS